MYTCGCTAIHVAILIFCQRKICQIGSVVLRQDLCSKIYHCQTPTHKHNTNHDLPMVSHMYYKTYEYLHDNLDLAKLDNSTCHRSIFLYRTIGDPFSSPSCHSNISPASCLLNTGVVPTILRTGGGSVD